MRSYHLLFCWVLDMQSIHLEHLNNWIDNFPNLPSFHFCWFLSHTKTDHDQQLCTTLFNQFYRIFKISFQNSISYSLCITSAKAFFSKKITNASSFKKEKFTFWFKHPVLSPIVDLWKNTSFLVLCVACQCIIVACKQQVFSLNVVPFLVGNERCIVRDSLIAVFIQNTDTSYIVWRPKKYYIIVKVLSKKVTCHLLLLLILFPSLSCALMYFVCYRNRIFSSIHTYPACIRACLHVYCLKVVSIGDWTKHWPRFVCVWTTAFCRKYNEYI